MRASEWIAERRGKALVSALVHELSQLVEHGRGGRAAAEGGEPPKVAGIDRSPLSLATRQKSEGIPMAALQRLDRRAKLDRDYRAGVRARPSRFFADFQGEGPFCARKIAPSSGQGLGIFGARAGA